MNKKILIPATALVLGLGLYTANATLVMAQGNADKQASLVQRLAKRFGLAENEVKTVFEEERLAHQAEKQAQFAIRLDEAVKNGQLTAQQKQLIIAKHEEIKQSRQADWQAWQQLTPEERHAKAQARRNELQSWAQANGIDASLFAQGEGMKRGDMGRGFGMGRGSGMAKSR